MKPSWTKEQQQVIDLRDRNILVSAAAGSGKTAVLVERIIEKITDETAACDIDRLLVVTFTKAAAAEMRSRIGSAIEEKIQEQPGNEHLQKQASLLHTAQITTIDSFCQNIIRNYFHVINLDPAFRVGDETEFKLMKEEVLKELLEEKYCQAKENKDEDFWHFTETLSPGRTDSAMEGMVLSLCEIANSYPWPEVWLRDCADMYQVSTLEELEESKWAKKLVAYLKECIQNFMELAVRAKEICEDAYGLEKYLDAISSDIAYLSRLQTANTYQEFSEIFARYNPAKLTGVRSENADVEKRELVKAFRNSYQKEGIAKIIDKFFFQSPEEMLSDIQAMAPVIQQLVSLTIEFRQAFAARKRDEGLIDFADMEHFALEILVDKDDKGVQPSETARELQKYYDEILIDEYQDSNYIQELLLKSLSRAPKEKPYLFMVGDVKQSIYKFRLARPELFMKKYDNYTTGESQYQRIDLHQNFRSREQVLASANFIFRQIMKKEFGGIEYDDAASLVPGADFGECDRRTSGPTELLLIEGQPDGEKIEKKVCEAAVIGQKIKDMVQGENPLYILDKGEYRRVRYGDIAILLRSLSGWTEDFTEVLNDMGIPVYSETKTGYFTTLEVETILNYLYIIDNPRQDIPLAAVLRSQLVQLTDEEMAWLGTMSQELNYWDKILDFMAFRKWQRGDTQVEEEFARKGVSLAQIKDILEMPEAEAVILEEKLSRFLDRLTEYQKFVQTKSVYELLRRIYDETGYYQIVSAMPSGEKRRANLDILLQQAIVFAQSGHRGIYGFTRYIVNLQKSDIDFGEATLANENMNAVRIMTIHKSKGLEFPIVFLAGMEKRFNLTDARKGVIINSDYGVGCDFTDLEKSLKQPTLIKRFLANETILSTLAEEIRILYVALTRAKEKLFMVGTVKNLPKKLTSWCVESLSLDYYQLTTAQSYLDWVMPALGQRSGFCQAVENFVGEEETHFRDETDALFHLEIFMPEDIVTQEKTSWEEDALRYEQLQQWDTGNTYDDAMREAIQEEQEYRYPYAYEANLPVKVSVSELKRRRMQQLQQLEEEDELGKDMSSTSVEKSSGETNPAEKISENDEITEKPDEAQKDNEIMEKPDEIQEDIEIPRPSFMQEVKEVSGAARGTLYHLVMEHFPYKEIASSEKAWTVAEFAAYLDKMVQQGYMTEEEKALLDCRKFVTFLDSGIGRRMAEAAAQKKLRLEQPFMMGVKASEIEKDNPSDELIMVQGIIDAYFEEEDAIVLVDYKTDAVKIGQEAQLVQKYQAQLEYYAQALERFTGKAVSEKIIYSFALGKEIPIE